MLYQSNEMRINLDGQIPGICPSEYSLKERVSAIITSGAVRIEFNSDVEININLIKRFKGKFIWFTSVQDNPR